MTDNEQYTMRAVDKEKAIKEALEEVYEYEEIYYEYSSDSQNGSMYDQYDDDDSEVSASAESSDNQHAGDMM